MKRIGKLLIKNSNDDTYLLLTRTDHPRYGADPDLPGGTLEPGESIHTAMIREVYEEIGLQIDEKSTKILCQTSKYSVVGNEFTLFYIELGGRPSVVLDWEHSAYRWCDISQVIVTARGATDPYMHMVADALEDKNSSRT